MSPMSVCWQIYSGRNTNIVKRHNSCQNNRSSTLVLIQNVCLSFFAGSFYFFFRLFIPLNFEYDDLAGKIEN